MNAARHGEESPVNVLLVDDDDNHLVLFGMAVRESKCDVRLSTAADGEQAIDYLEGKGIYADRSMHPLPDVLVLDLRMPRVDGFEFLARRRDSLAFSMLPVMIFSGVEDQEEIERALALGASHFLAKPHNFQGYKEVVQAVWEFGMKCSGNRGISRSGAE
jgi:CheY-like chemotaxis protein